jgi:hypothetical protein
MAKFQVSGVRRWDGPEHGHITHLYGPHLPSCSVPDAIRNIESGLHSYYLVINGSQRPLMIVRPDAAHPYLQASLDGVLTNDLLEVDQEQS